MRGSTLVTLTSRSNDYRCNESLALRRSWLLALFVAFCLCNATTVPSRAVVSWDNQSDAPTQTMA